MECAIKTVGQKYGVRRQAKRDAALDCSGHAKIRSQIEVKRRRASLAAALHSVKFDHAKKLPAMRPNVLGRCRRKRRCRL